MTEQVDAADAAGAAGQAAAAAGRAAAAAGVRVDELRTIDELHAGHELAVAIWQSAPNNPPITAELMRAIGHAGGYVAGAFGADPATGQERLVGVCVGFLGRGATMHSHLTGVDARLRGREVGYALKLHQRSWALRNGIDEIHWTFDPLLRRNAYFNLAKLGATAWVYEPDFYGVMDDGLNAGDDSDRIVVAWRLAEPQVVRACAGTPVETDAPGLLAAGAATGLDIDADGWPAQVGPDDQPDPAEVAGGVSIVLVRVPADLASVKTADPSCAKAWRHAVRQTLGQLMTAGARVIGFHRAGWYVIDLSTIARADDGA